jgi:hypothetical protein
MFSLNVPRSATAKIEAKDSNSIRGALVNVSTVNEAPINKRIKDTPTGASKLSIQIQVNAIQLK